MHRQTRPGLVTAGGFALAAGSAALLPHHTGAWLPLHLFLLGAMVHAIGAVTLMLAVTWSAAPAPPRLAVRVQRFLLTGGIIGVAISRERGASGVLMGVSASAIAASFISLAMLLIAVRQQATVKRFRPAIEGYVAALGFATIGSGLGAAMTTGHGTEKIRITHLTINLFGLIGIVIAATLPYMTATQIRSKMAKRATPATIRSGLALLVAATVVAALGTALDRPIAAALGMALYAVGLAGIVLLCPVPRWRQIQWAGPRLASLALGVLWWIAVTITLMVRAATGATPPTNLIIALVVGGFGQILLGSLAYLAPVLRGGGHARLAAGFRLTRSWPAVIAANIAAGGAVLDSAVLCGAGIAAVLIDSLVRAIILARPRATVTI